MVDGPGRQSRPQPMAISRFYLALPASCAVAFWRSISPLRFPVRCRQRVGGFAEPGHRSEHVERGPQAGQPQTRTYTDCGMRLLPCHSRRRIVRSRIFDSHGEASGGDARENSLCILLLACAVLCMAGSFLGTDSRRMPVFLDPRRAAAPANHEPRARFILTGLGSFRQAIHPSSFRSSPRWSATTGHWRTLAIMP
jgi:hypothetical protein